MPGKLNSSINKPGCPYGNALLKQFHHHIEALPLGVENSPTAFAGDPTGCVGEDEDAWEKFDGPLNTVLQKSHNELKELVQVGNQGHWIMSVS